ncbi:SRPBCC domain-containing protein [Chitinophagaceae bacterium LWZ2-11]
MKSEPFVIERTLNASVERVWKALTDKKQMKEWYFDLSDFKPEVGFEFQFEGGSKEMTYLHLCKVIEVIPHKKLTYSWRYKDYAGNSFVTFELFPESDKTRLKLTHEGLESFPPVKDFAKESFSKGWTHIIGTSLPTYLEKQSI